MTYTPPTVVGPIGASSVAVSGLTGATSASRLVGANTSGAPTGGTFSTGDISTDHAGAAWICTAGGTPGTWIQVSPGPTGAPGTTGGTDATGLLDRLRSGIHANNLGNMPAGSGEFDIVFVSGLYYFFHWELTGGLYQTFVRSASTVTGLVSATDTEIVPGVFPTALFDGTLWHVWAVDYNASGPPTKHWTASVVTGPYTYSDTLPGISGNIISDPCVRQSPIDGKYYCTYKQINSPYKTGTLVATSINGAWTDLGLCFAGSVTRAAWHSFQESDPNPIFWGGRAYIAFGASGPTTSFPQRVSLVEVDPTTMQAIAPATVISDALEAWQTVNEVSTFNPAWLAIPGEPGRERLFYGHIPPDQSTTWGWSYVQVGPPPPDGRRTWSALRLDCTVALDKATGIPPTLHGGAVASPNGLACPATPSGAYGWLGVSTLADFTAAVQFSLVTLPGSDGLVLRASPLAMGTNEIWLGVTSVGLLKAKVVGSTTLTLTGVTTLTTGTVYRALLRRLGSEVRLYLNGNEETSGTQGDALTGVQEWSIANDTGSTQAAGEQLVCTIFAATITAEALPLGANPFVGLPISGGSTALSPATGTALGGVIVPVVSGMTVDGSGNLGFNLGAGLAINGSNQLTATVSSGASPAFLDGLSPLTPAEMDDGSDWAYPG